jgi:GTP-binding protein
VNEARSKEAAIATVAIVGRTNVGKSTLFNRLVGRRRSITLDTPGVTRDPIAEEVVIDGRRLRIVDTGGLGGEAELKLADQVHAHTLRSVEDADLIVVVFDARAGVTPIDRETVDLLTRLKTPLLFVANKCDGAAVEEASVEFCSLGIDPPLPVSAEHGLGTGELKDAILEALDRSRPAGADDVTSTAPAHAACRIAIVGRPNVGKSSLLNALAGAERSLVDDIPGTTRDVVDMAFERNGRRYVLLDTAGMRRPARVVANIEKLSVGRSVEAVKRCDVTLLLIEPTEGMTDQEARIAQLALREGRALVVVLNKIDLLTSRPDRTEWRDTMFARYPTLGIAEFEMISAKESKGLDRLSEAVDRARSAHDLEIQTATLNRVLGEILARREPPMLGRGRLKLLYAAQTGRRPPTITFFANRESVPTEYQRFVEASLREALPLRGTPIRLRFKRRPSHGPDRR